MQFTKLLRETKAFASDFSDTVGGLEFDIIGPFTFIEASNQDHRYSCSVGQVQLKDIEDEKDQLTMLEAVRDEFCKKLSKKVEALSSSEDIVKKSKAELIQKELDRLKNCKTLEGIKNYEPIEGTPKGSFTSSLGRFSSSIGGGTY